MNKIPVILVHGAWHGAWCWQHIIPLLQAQEFNVITPNLPEHDNNALPTLDSYVKYIIEIIETFSCKVHLVGHSMAGIILSEIAEKIPQRIESLIYIAAFLLKNGQSLLESAKHNPSTIMEAFTFSDDYLSIDASKAPFLFYNQCSKNILKIALPKLKPQPMLPLLKPIAITQEHFGSVRKHYIMCCNDNATIPAFQQAMCAAYPDMTLTSIDSDHSPFFSQPRKLAWQLTQLINSN